MSKVVIVFSTYYYGDGRLFNSEKPEKFSSESLCDYFWKQIKRMSDAVWYDIIESLDLSKLDSAYKNHIQTVLNVQNEYNGISKKINDIYSKYPSWPKELSYQKLLLYLMNDSSNKNNKELIADLELLKELSSNKDERKTRLVAGLKSLDPTTLTLAVKEEGGQRRIDMYFPGETGSNVPYLFQRFSYVGIDNNDLADELKLYAVWPIEESSGTINNVGDNKWIKALSEQFVRVLNPDCKDLYLILHNKDLEETTYKVIEYAQNQGQFTRSIALFQHSTGDPIGEILSQQSTKDVLRAIGDKIKKLMLFFPIEKDFQSALNKSENVIDSLSQLNKKLIETLDKVEPGKVNQTIAE